MGYNPTIEEIKDMVEQVRVVYTVNVVKVRIYTVN
jgi:hypothetical protein